MHPNVFLRTFWRAQLKPEIFVAMSFDDDYKKRFDDIIEPAIESIPYKATKLKARRVDMSKSGDSILTDIADGIAHAAMVLADVSTVGKDARTGKPYRNGNVLYEVGLALACRQSAEVLLIRDDKDQFLFDVSTIPHKHLDFSDATKATSDLRDELESRLREIDLIGDARVQMAVATLTSQEQNLLKGFSQFGADVPFHFVKEGNLFSAAAITRLLDKQLIRTTGLMDERNAIFQWTPFGRAIADQLEKLIPRYKTPAPEAATSSETPDSNIKPP
jgi:hypothetical protein